MTMFSAITTADRCRAGLAAVMEDYDVFIAPSAVGEAPAGTGSTGNPPVQPDVDADVPAVHPSADGLRTERPARGDSSDGTLPSRQSVGDRRPVDVGSPGLVRNARGMTPRNELAAHEVVQPDRVRRNQRRGGDARMPRADRGARTGRRGFRVPRSGLRDRAGESARRRSPARTAARAPHRRQGLFRDLRHADGLWQRDLRRQQHRAGCGDRHPDAQCRRDHPGQDRDQRIHRVLARQDSKPAQPGTHDRRIVDGFGGGRRGHDGACRFGDPSRAARRSVPRPTAG